MEDIRPYYRAMRRSIGRAIHAERQKQNISLWKIEQHTGLSSWQVDHIELGKGELKIDQLLRLARFLGLEVKLRLQKRH